MYFFVEASDRAAALAAVPSGFLRTPTTVSEVEAVYKRAASGATAE